MDAEPLNLNLGMLCSCCDFHSYELPEVEGLNPGQRQVIEELCKLCIESFRPSAADSGGY